MSKKKNESGGLAAAVERINKNFGAGSIMKLGDDPLDGIEAIPSGSIELDYALGIGGYPKGRFTEIYGDESSGKTTLTLHAIAEAQKKGGVAAFIDAEYTFDPKYAANIGVNVDELFISQPNSGEEGLEVLDELVKSGGLDIIVVDSVAALTPRAEKEGEMGDSQIGLHARLMSKALRKIAASVSQSNTCVIFINQLRHRIGVMFGNPETTTGGKALAFYASIQVRVSRSSQIKFGDEIVGNKTKIKVVKNKVAPAHRTAEFDIIYGKGISKVGEILDFAVRFQIVDKSGSWYKYEDSNLAQGRDSTIELLNDNPELLEELEIKVRTRLNE